MRNPENVLNGLQKHSKEPSYKYERIYRNLFNRSIFMQAYQNIYASQGNMTAGTDGKTIDAKSIEMAKSRGLVMGQKVRVLTEGEDADQAMEAFTQLFEFGPKKKRVQ